jgi:hypothetical protein
MSRAVLLVVTALVCAVPGTPGAQGPPTRVPPAPVRDTSAPLHSAALSAVMHGQVVAAETGAPLRSAYVTARAGTVVISTRTDEQGRFTLKDLPPAEYTVIASRPGYIDQGLGQPTPMSPSRQVILGAGANAGPLTFALQRGGVISGRVRDAEGVPVERIQVQAARLRRFANEWRLLPATEMVSTDDLGEYRVHGLAPGNYLVTAEPLRWRRDGVAGEGRADVATYAPSTTNPADAVRVRVEAGSEAQADVTLIEAEVVSVSGRLLSSKGTPIAQGSLRLESRGAIRIARYQNLTTGPDGEFDIERVGPGPYRLLATMPVTRTPADREVGQSLTEYGVLDIDVGHQPLTDLVVRTSAGGSASGRLIIDGDAARLTGRTVHVVANALEFGTPFSRGVVRPDLTFTIAGIHGPSMLRINGVPEGWWTRAVRVRGRDVTDRIEVPAGTVQTDVDIIVSTTPTGVRGTVRRREGAPDDVVVMLFVRDAARWLESPTAAGITMVRPIEDGTFWTSLRPGAYHAIALPAGVVGDRMSDPELLGALAPHAQPVDVGEDAEVRIDLSVWVP